MEEINREERIRQRAYEIWEAEGRIDGHHERHWHDASQELDHGKLPFAPDERTSKSGRAIAKTRSRDIGVSVG
ncbi:hypothetical protein ACO34A_28585 (plasmid) [Rhizobium sp. ACO-34A]|nr:DUF2934 domain-containing protein [Rhizobium sp. ACO-34A]ATN37725.1 hypothetical protein ACO34A_28585 [Rhizobium sp. ACO-34A]